jgi:glycosyltransferase involved in cell wall biosynthesis
MKNMKKVSVIMASYLGFYEGRTSNPNPKFIRAVKSFLSQTYENKELIIVADGCMITEQLYNENFSKFENIKFIRIPKQPLYGGDIRNAGIDIATGEIISYLDNDDVLGKNHLTKIMNEFTDDLDLLYYDDYLVTSADFKKLHLRINETRYGSIGTSSITHRNFNDPKFDGVRRLLKWVDGYGHDFIFLSLLIINGFQFKKMSIPSEYLVCHYGGGQNRGDF